MGKLTYTFHSLETVENTKQMIIGTIVSMCGKIKKIDGDVIIGTWRTRKYQTLLPVKFTFYVGVDMVRVLAHGSCVQYVGTITIQGKLCGEELIWDAFIKALHRRYPDIDFGVTPGEAQIEAIRFIGDGIEEVFTATTRNRPSWGGALIGGALFGTAGAIIGASSGYSYTSGETCTRFSDELLAIARYTNGLTIEGSIKKNSNDYNIIKTNMTLLKTP